jgi:hypothetical protein
MQNFNSANDNDASTPDTNDLTTVYFNTKNLWASSELAESCSNPSSEHDNTKDNKY